MRPYAISGITQLVLAAIAVYVFRIDHMGPWGAAGVATALGVAGLLIGVRAFGDRLDRPRRTTTRPR